MSVTVRALPNGPLMVRGECVVVDRQGAPIQHPAEQQGPVMLLCRCGNSANKPFCDGSHKRIGFTD